MQDQYDNMIIEIYLRSAHMTLSKINVCKEIKLHCVAGPSINVPMHTFI